MQNEMMILESDISMTTVEITELTNKRHDNVMVDAKKMLLELYGESSLLKFQESYIASNGQFYDCYRLPEEEILVLVSGYSIKLRMKIIKRLKELEKRNNPENLTRLDLLELAMDSEKKRLALEQQNQKMLPKVASFDKFIETAGLFTLTGAMKTLNLPPNKTIKKLRTMKILYLLDGHNVPFEKYMKKGFFVVQTTINHHQQKSYPQTYVTETGLPFINDLLSEPVLLTA